MLFLLHKLWTEYQRDKVTAQSHLVISCSGRITTEVTCFQSPELYPVHSDSLGGERTAPDRDLRWELHPYTDRAALESEGLFEGHRENISWGRRLQQTLKPAFTLSDCSHKHLSNGPGLFPSETCWLYFLGWSTSRSFKSIIDDSGKDGASLFYFIPPANYN